MNSLWVENHPVYLSVLGTDSFQIFVLMIRGRADQAQEATSCASRPKTAPLPRVGLGGWEEGRGAVALLQPPRRGQVLEVSFLVMFWATCGKQKPNP